MSERTDATVECVVCNTEFDPTAAGGWCTNPECGEWRYEDDDIGGTDEEAESESDSIEEPVPSTDEDDERVGRDPLGESEPTSQIEETGPGSPTEEPEPESPSEEPESPTAEAESQSGEAKPESPAEETEPASPTEESVEDDAGKDETDIEAEDETDIEAEDEEVGETDEEPTETVSDAEEEPQEISCPGCGETLDADANFCPSCGEDVSDIEPGEDEEELTACPSCSESVDPEDSFCANCGENLDEHREPEPLTECPSCEADIDDEDSFCSECGENLDEHREGGDAASETSAAAESAPTADETATTAEAETASQQEAQPEHTAADQSAEAEPVPSSLLLETRGREVAVSDGETVGRELRKIITETGGDEDEAVRVHREHIRFVRDEGQFYLDNLGKNPTAVNGRTLDKGDRVGISPGDEITLSDAISLTVARP